MQEHEKSADEAQTDTVALAGPQFNADSAFNFVAMQCSFGPRTMNSEAHDRCEKWIVNQFEKYGMKVERQRADLKGYDGTTLKSCNIIARYNPDAKKRIVICSHWDSRPWADNDYDKNNWHKPVMGANDGASGVGVMLELARLLQNDSTLSLGIDFVCFDAEDWARPNGKRTSLKKTPTPSERNTGRPICPKATSRSTAFYSTWWADRAQNSIRKACRRCMHRT